MPKLERIGRKLVVRKGFWFASGRIFGPVRTDDVLSAIFGDIMANSLDFRLAHDKVEVAVTSIFNGLIARSELYFALRAHSAFYETVAADIETDGRLTGDIVKAVENTHVTARQAFTGHADETELLVAVDAWTKIRDTVASLPPVHQFCLASRPLEVDDLSFSLKGLSVAAGNAAEWPPACFDASDVAILSKSDLRTNLYGRSTASSAALPALPTRTSDPLVTRLFLCCLALHNYTERSEWLLALAPVAQYTDARQRWDWSRASGGGSTLYWTMELFMSKSILAFQKGKVLSIGLATPWFGRPWAAVPTADDPQNTGGLTQCQIWSNFCHRLGVAIVLHKHANGVELIIFDPLRCYNHVKHDPYFSANKMAILSFRLSIREKAEDMVKQLGVPLVRGWWGGKLDMECGSADSVQIATEWVRQVVLAGRDGDPFVVDDTTWERWGFEAVIM
ncbi:hypothetical protein C8034_v003577 [Colletotrichum sidae]|uniref:Uncharacterized protein n=1 Tax=Colletotrichum sidae TaxID=1347389 RepID=A0A4R8TRM4_9PEZI|nr:hypothetical protein C8034_v003577 [Colletotrichum sidae]